MDEIGLGQRLQAARRAAGLTQQQLCHQAGLSYSTLAKIERGAIKAPSIFTIQSIAAVLGTTLDNLLGLVSAVPAKATKRVAKSGIRFIYFDVNGCLVRFFQAGFNRLSQESGVPADLVESAFWHYNDDVCRGDLTVAEFNHAFAKRLGLAELDWQSYYLDAVEPIAEMHELATWVGSQYQIGLLTNIMPGFMEALRSKKLIPDLHYDVIVESSSARAIKPEKKIFDIATERAGVNPEEILFVDDDRSNLRAAEHLGWRVLWFDDYRPDDFAGRIKDILA